MLKKKNQLCYCEGEQSLEYFAQRCSGVSTYGDTQNPTGYGSGQPTLGDPAWARGFTIQAKEVLSKFSCSVIPCFCEKY